ncbi:hypothetical protein ACI65C_004040 [Semiaphis heraclei]
MDTSNEQTTTNTSSHHIFVKTNSMHTTFNLPLYNTHLQKTWITSEISNKNNAQISQDNNYYDILDPQSYQATFKRPAPESTCLSSPSSYTLTSLILEFSEDAKNFSNKDVNIHDLCNNIGSKATEVLDMAEKVRPLMVDKKIKTKIARLTKLLFQSIPLFEDLTLQTSKSNQSNQ